MKRRFNTVLAGWFALALATLLPLAVALAQVPAAPKGDSGSTDVLNAGERIVVILSDIPNGPPPQEVVISEDGKITLHLDKTFTAAGKTRSQLEKEIKEYYVPNFYTRMTVTVKQEERFVYVDGFVKAPNNYPYRPGMTLLKAITVAGGFSEFGKKSEVTITRDGREQKVDCEKALKDPKLDRPLFPGDRIYVPRRFF
jgi:protein involved in polysaccharide export with SLBB domain